MSMAESQQSHIGLLERLDDPIARKDLDPRDTFGSTEMLPQQLTTGWDEARSRVELPSNFAKPDIAFCGMGASIYGGKVVEALFEDSMASHIKTFSKQNVPPSYGENSLFVLTSYSGNTAETLACADEARERHAGMLVITKGGELARFAEDTGAPAYIFDGKLNPAGIPRLGNGYTIAGLMGILDMAGIIDVGDTEFRESVNKLERRTREVKEQAKELAQRLHGKIPEIYTAEHLVANGHIMRNQFNETSKSAATMLSIPDANHHALEGMMFPGDVPFHDIMIDSKNYSEDTRKRMDLTADVIADNGREITRIDLSGETPLEDFFNVLSFGSYLTFYLGIIHKQDPAVNPFVDFLKEKIKRKARDASSS